MAPAPWGDGMAGLAAQDYEEGGERASGERVCNGHDGEELLLPGALIAERYELTRPLSYGGMGAIWIALDTVLDIPVAIKFIREDLSVRAVGERLMLEARLAARIEHPAIVRVFGLDATRSGAPFIVMELLEGEDLRTLLDRVFRVTPLEAVAMLLPIASALSAAHDRGVLHRDLKPENVFIAIQHGRSQPKVVDFGIAAPLDRQRRRLTNAGAVVGSPDYLSPEQALGRDDVDQRVDVWGFCALLYECVTGFPPFAQSTTEELLRDVVSKPVRPLSDFGFDEPELWAIIHKGLAKDREQRWPDMRSVSFALSSWLVDRGVEDDICGRSLRSELVRTTPLPAEPTPPVVGHDTPTIVRRASQRGERRGSSRRQLLPAVSRIPPSRVVLAGLAVLLVAACAHASTLFSPRGAQAVRTFSSAEILAARRVATPAVLTEAAPGQRHAERAERANPRTIERPRAAPARPKPLPPPGFDPVLGF